LNAHANKSQENNNKTVVPVVTQTQGAGEGVFQFIDNRTENASLHKLQDLADNSPKAIQFKFLQNMANQRSDSSMLAQLQTKADKKTLPNQVTQLKKGERWPSMRELDKLKPPQERKLPQKVEGEEDPRFNTEEESGRAKTNFGKMKNVVVGNKKRVDEELTKAGVPEEIHDEAATETRRKRLTGGDWEDRSQFEQNGVDEKGNRKMGYAAKDGERDAKGNPIVKINSRHQLDDEQRKGLAAYRGTEGLSEAYQEHARKHLEKFNKAHAFISAWAMSNILGVWKNWGSDSNFVSPLSMADAYLTEAEASGGGIATLEKKLGVPEGNWSNGGKESTIYRFIVQDPQKFHVRLPSGKEGQAYQKEWLSGGKTLGGGDEAVINSMSLEDLKASVAAGAIEIIMVVFSSDGKAVQSKHDI
jgi:hypothetical protein